MNDTTSTPGACASFLFFFGRLMVSIIFAFAGAGKLYEADHTAAYMLSKGMTMIPFFLYAAAAVEILGALSLLLGYKLRWGAALLFLFLIPVSLIFHDFWNVGVAEKQMEMIKFLQNIAIMGGLLYIVGAGAGRFSVDHYRS